ncbi:glycosyltransferase [Bacteroides ovatus]|nr:glycosyltransferase [Bacteroides ovatus]
MERKNYDDNLLLIVLRKGTEYYKGLLLLIDAFDIVKEKVSNAKLAIVGTDEVRSQEGVTYYHNKSRETTVELFKRCTLYTMPALAETQWYNLCGGIG